MHVFHFLSVTLFAFALGSIAHFPGDMLPTDQHPSLCGTCESSCQSSIHSSNHPASCSQSGTYRAWVLGDLVYMGAWAPSEVGISAIYNPSSQHNNIGGQQ